MENKKETIQKITTELLGYLGITGKTVITEEEETVRVNIETEQSGALIGYHGEGLVSLQLLLNIIVHKKTGEWQKVVVNVGDYREKREEYLKNLALSAANKVRETQRQFFLNDLSSFERRIVHMVLSEEKDIETASEGEGRDRKLVIKLKSQETSAAS